LDNNIDIKNGTYLDNKKNNVQFPGGEITIKILASENMLLPAFTGSIVRGALFKLISKVNPELAIKLHRGNERSPYAIRPLMKSSGTKKRTARNEMVIEKGDELVFKIKLLENKLLEDIIRIFIGNESPTLSILEKDFPVVSMEYKKISFEVKEYPKRMKMIFETPTYFASKLHSYPVLFPDPSYVFSNLIKIWNCFNGKYGTITVEKLVKWVKDHVIVLDYRLRTKKVFIEKNTPIKGFTGWVVYGIKNKEWQSWIYLLSSYAELSNVGGSRTAGLGCVKFRPLEDVEKGITMTEKN